jgi:hypothetical protein
LLNVSGELGIEKTGARQDVKRSLEAIQFVRVTFRLVRKGLGGCDEQIELFLRQESQVVQVVLFDEGKGQWAERFRLPDAQRQQEIIVSAGLVRCHGRSS